MDFRFQTTIILTVFAVASIIGTALVTKDTRYEAAFFYVLAFWLIALPVVDTMFQKRAKRKKK